MYGIFRKYFYDWIELNEDLDYLINHKRRDVPFPPKSILLPRVKTITPNLAQIEDTPFKVYSIKIKTSQHAIRTFIDHGSLVINLGHECTWLYPGLGLGSNNRKLNAYGYLDIAIIKGELL